MSDNETSSRRAEANRKNAQKSTGPKTAEGKARSRFNAVKHGMRAATPVLPGEDKAAFDARLERWAKDLAPRDDVEQFLVKRAVELSWQLERADRAIALSRRPAEERIAAVLDEVLALGRRLFWDPRGPVGLYPQITESDGMLRQPSWNGQIDDPDDPARLVNRLESTAAGCGWMLDRWAELREVLEAGLLWQAPDRLKAVRLLGKQPLDAATDWRVMKLYFSAGAMTPAAKQDFKDLADEMFTEQKKIFVERVQGRLVPGVRPNDPESGKAALLELIAEEEERLEALLAEHLERTEPAVGESFDATDAGERLRRYQASCDRGLLRVLEAIRKRQREADRGKKEPSPKAAKPSKPDEKDQKDQWRLIGRVLDVMAEARANRRRAGRPTRWPRPARWAPAPDVAPRFATIEPNAAPAEAPATATTEPKAPAPAAGPAFPAFVVMLLALVVGLSGAVLERSNPTGSGGRTEPAARAARRGVPDVTRSPDLDGSHGPQAK